MFNPWNSHGPKTYKINLIKTIVNRLKIIYSDELLFNRDLNQLKESFLWSGYFRFIVEKYIKIYINQSRKSLQKLLNVPKIPIYFGF